MRHGGGSDGGDDTVDRNGRDVESEYGVGG